MSQTKHKLIVTMVILLGLSIFGMAQDLILAAGPNNAYLYQEGDGNTADIMQQEALESWAVQMQQGNTNTVYIYQAGEKNFSSQTQTGNSNSAYANNRQ